MSKPDKIDTAVGKAFANMKKRMGDEAYNSIWSIRGGLPKFNDIGSGKIDTTNTKWRLNDISPADRALQDRAKAKQDVAKHNTEQKLQQNLNNFKTSGLISMPKIHRFPWERPGFNMLGVPKFMNKIKK
jgi:hypothetical protein